MTLGFLLSIMVWISVEQRAVGEQVGGNRARFTLALGSGAALLLAPLAILFDPEKLGVGTEIAPDLTLFKAGAVVVFFSIAFLSCGAGLISIHRNLSSVRFRNRE